MLRDFKVHLFLPFIHFIYICFISWLIIVLLRIGRATRAKCSSSIQSRGGSYTRSSQDAAGMSKHELSTAVQKLHSDPLLVDRKRAHHDTEHQSSCMCDGASRWLRSTLCFPPWGRASLTCHRPGFHPAGQTSSGLSWTYCNAWGNIERRRQL
jgi:hypothetical protein